jgi:hypothetical protein
MLISSTILTDDSSTALGIDALLNNTSNGNTALGFNALYSNTTGNENTANGTYSLNNNTIGIKNTSIGAGSLTMNETGQRNTAIGNYALRINTVGSYNTAIGVESLKSNISGEKNTAIGFNADVADDLQNAISIGYNAKATKSNTIQLGNNYITNINTSGTIKSGGIISKLVSINDNYTVLPSDEIIIVNSTSLKTITLPNASELSGRTYLIKRIGTGTITVAAATSDYIDGLSTFTLGVRYKYVKLVSDGTTNWVIVGNN